MLSVTNGPGQPANYPSQAKEKKKEALYDFSTFAVGVIFLGSIVAISRNLTDEKDPQQQLFKVAVTMACCFATAMAYACAEALCCPREVEKKHKIAEISPDLSGKPNASGHTLCLNIQQFPAFVDLLNRTRKSTDDKTTKDRTDRNGVKALLRHHMEEMKKSPYSVQYGNLSSSYITLDELLSERERLAQATETGQLVLFQGSAELQGPRSAMEDAQLMVHNGDSYLCGVFDGHAGDKASKYVSEQFRLRFFDQLNECKGDVYETFQQLFAKIDEDGRRMKFMNFQGTTAVVCYVSGRKIWTATLGDSEANIYRMINGKLKSVPLSYVHDWSHPKDAKRATAAIGKQFNLTAEGIASMKMNWISATEPKDLRFPVKGGLNVSRDLGCNALKNYIPEHPAISSEPKITCEDIDDGDFIILCCDGLKDYFPEKGIVETIKTTGQFSEIPSALAQAALNHMSEPQIDRFGEVENGYGDNVTVIGCRVQFKHP